MGIKIEVAYAKVEVQVILALEVEVGCTLREAIERSGIVGEFPELDLKRQQVGVFGMVRGLEDRVQEGDRVEIYRELVRDPREARRLRARNGKA